MLHSLSLWNDIVCLRIGRNTRNVFLAATYNRSGTVSEEHYDFQSHCHSDMEDCGSNYFLYLTKNISFSRKISKKNVVA